MHSSDTVLGRLRSATCDAHQQLETRLQVISRLRCGTERRLLIGNYQKLYLGAANLLVVWFDGGHGLPPPSQALCGAAIAWVDIRSRAEALGFRYVIEGSALGGRMILGELDALGVDTTDLAFLNPHGDSVGTVWRSFTALLERELAAPAALCEAVSGAEKGFEYARICLCDGLPPAA